MCVYVRGQVLGLVTVLLLSCLNGVNSDMGMTYRSTHGPDEIPVTAAPYTQQGGARHRLGGMSFGSTAHLGGLSFDTIMCKPNVSFTWCLPPDYNQEKHPFTFFYLSNKSLPWDYNFKFVIEEISNINDKAQSMVISMYFAVSWEEPRMVINQSSTDWNDERTGPMNEVNESPETLLKIWYPELEIYGLETFGRQSVLKEMSGVRIMKNRTINYELGVRITISCRMNFDDYPLDAHTCQFQVGSYYDTKETVTCKAHFIYDAERQRSLQHFLTIEDLPEEFHTVVIPSGNYSACGFQVRLQRKQMQSMFQVYLPSCMFVIVSWVSFMVKPEVVPGRMAMLVTLFLVLINIFNSVREQAPISSRLNAVDLYLVVCIFFVFTALLEYAAILLMLKKRRKPRRTIDEGLKNLFSQSNSNNDTGQHGGRRKQPRVREQQQTGEDSQGEETGHMLELEVDTHRNGRRGSTGGRQQDRQARQARHKPTRSKYVEVGLTARKQALVDNIDAWAMWISPPVFILFNLVYWVAYRHVEPTQLFKLS